MNYRKLTYITLGALLLTIGGPAGKTPIEAQTGGADKPKVLLPGHVQNESPDLTKPKAVISGPPQVYTNEQIILSAAGSISVGDPEIKGTDPLTPEVGSMYDRNGKLLYGLVSIPVPGKYRFVVVAYGPNSPDPKIRPPMDFAFMEVEVLSRTQPKPEPKPDPTPNPPTPPVPPSPYPPIPPTPPTPPIPPAPAKDSFGLYTFTKDTVGKINWDPNIKGPGAKVISAVFLKYAQANASSYATPNDFVTATLNDYKSQLGPAYPGWSLAFFTPLRTKLEELNRAMKLPSTVQAHQEAWMEISNALKEFGN